MKRLTSILLAFLMAMAGWCQSEWFGVYIKGNKAGYMMYDTQDGPEGKITESVSLLGGKMLGSDLEIKIVSKTWADSKGRLQKMLINSTSGGKTQVVKVRVEGQKIQAVSAMDGRETKREIDVPEGAEIVDDPLSLVVNGEHPKTVYVFDSTTMALVKCDPVAKGEVEIDTKHGKVKAQSFDMRDPRAPMVIYLSAKGDLIKAVGPFGMEVYPETKEEATAASSGADIAVASAVEPNKPIDDFLNVKNLKLSVSGADLSHVPSDNHQTLQKTGDKWLLTIHPVQPESLSNTDLSGADPQWTRPDQHVPSDSPKFKAKAKQIVGTSKGVMERIEKLRLWVQTRVRANAGIGVLRDADDVMESGEGVCRDHAILLATLLRADDVPCRLVSGMVYANGAFYYHAWVEAWVGGQWLGVDSTRPTKGLDATHIKTAQGTVSDVFTSFLLDGISIEVLGP